MTCPFCAASGPLVTYPVSGGPDGAGVEICQTCIDQIEGEPEPNRWRGLSGTIWEEDPALKVLSLRMLRRLGAEGWARDALDQVWLDEETQAWADNVPQESRHRDAHGATLNAGDTVVLVKDLPVKGAGFTAKRGTAVRGIALVPDNPGQIEGRVEGQRIVILTEFVKRK